MLWREKGEKIVHAHSNLETSRMIATAFTQIFRVAAPQVRQRALPPPDKGIRYKKYMMNIMEQDVAPKGTFFGPIHWS